MRNRSARPTSSLRSNAGVNATTLTASRSSPKDLLMGPGQIEAELLEHLLTAAANPLVIPKVGITGAALQVAKSRRLFRGQEPRVNGLDRALCWRKRDSNPRSPHEACHVSSYPRNNSMTVPRTGEGEHVIGRLSCA